MHHSYSNSYMTGIPIARRNRVSVFNKILVSLLVLVCITASAQTENSQPGVDRNINELVEVLNSDILELEFLSEKLKSVDQLDQSISKINAIFT